MAENPWDLGVDLEVCLFELLPIAAFRLDFTACALRRRPGNEADRLDETRYRRVTTWIIWEDRSEDALSHQRSTNANLEDACVFPRKVRFCPSREAQNKTHLRALAKGMRHPNHAFILSRPYASNNLQSRDLRALKLLS